MLTRIIGVAAVTASAVVVASFGFVLWVISTAWDMDAEEALDEMEMEPWVEQQEEGDDDE